MSQKGQEFLNRARCALDKLVDCYAKHPDVSLIDVGQTPEGDEQAGEIVLRIHVRKRWMEADPDDRITFPEQVDGIPVIIMRGDYQIEPDPSP